MVKAIVVRFPEVCAAPKIKDPLGKTVHMAIRKERERKAQRAPRDARFNPIRGLDRVR